METQRKIIHVDMDAFYASVEQRDNPDFRGRPVIVGGSPKSRGVVAACSYEAREYGIHSAMASARAYILCPKAVFVKPRFYIYKLVSAQIREIFHEYTHLVEPLSLDEAFLDVTCNKKEMTSATAIAREILAKIYKKTNGLTASAGVSFNKFLAKVASDIHKPNGLTVITPQKADLFIDQLPIGKFFGVGRVTEKKMIRLGIRTGADLKRFKKEKLLRLFGKAGGYFYDIAHCKDDRPVITHWIRKSIGKEVTLKEDIEDTTVMLAILDQLAHQVAKTMSKNQREGLTITLKIKYFDFKCITRSLTVSPAISKADEIMTYVPGLLQNTAAGTKKVRLLGISVSNFLDEDRRQEKYYQLPLPFEVVEGTCDSSKIAIDLKGTYSIEE
jgi:DNA polymerase IV